MKKKINFKIILLVLTVLALFVMPAYVFATDGIEDFFNTGWEDITDGTGSEGTGTEGKENTENGTNTGTGTQENGSNNNANTNADNTNTNTNTNNNVSGTNTNTNQNNNKKPESYDKAGIAEDTMMVVAVIAFVMIAICAYNKVNEYKGI